MSKSRTALTEERNGRILLKKDIPAQMAIEKLWMYEYEESHGDLVEKLGVVPEKPKKQTFFGALAAVLVYIFVGLVTVAVLSGLVGIIFKIIEWIVR